MKVRFEFEYEGTQNLPDEHPGNFWRDADRDYARLPEVGEGIEFDPGSEDGGGAGTVTWIMWGGDGTPRLHLKVKALGSYVTRAHLLQVGWKER